MTEPLAILLYEKLMPGSQLVNRLQDLGYRVHTLNDPDRLVGEAEETKPMVVIADLFSGSNRVLLGLSRLRRHPPTSHIPVIAFSGEGDPKVQDAAREAGASLVVSEAAISHHLPQLLDQALTQF
jgi:PleD family two-component response regulator